MPRPDLPGSAILLPLLLLLLLPSLLQEYIMNKLQKQLEKLAGEKATLQRERTDLQRQTSELSAAVDKLNRDKVGTALHNWRVCSACTQPAPVCPGLLLLLLLLVQPHFVYPHSACTAGLRCTQLQTYIQCTLHQQTLV
jgi:hypothetical protein